MHLPKLVPHWTTADGQLVQLYHGDVLQTLRRMPSSAVQCIVTSPPYWGLRDYSVCSCRDKPAENRSESSTLNPGGGEATPSNFGKPKPDCPICQGTGFDLTMTTWVGGDLKCDHIPPAVRQVDYRGSSTLGGGVATQNMSDYGTKGYKDVCGKCCARRINCQLGSEKVPDCLGWARGGNCADDHAGGNWIQGCHVCRMVLVFREARRVLRDDGVCWVNYGDTYAQGMSGKRGESHGSGDGMFKRKFEQMHGEGETTDHRKSSHYRESRTLETHSNFTDGDGVYARRADRQSNNGTFSIEADTGLASGNLIGVPWRFALAMQADGWILRSDIPWLKRAPMPESADNRPGKALEYVFMFAKQMGYFFDMDAVRRPQKEFVEYKDCSNNVISKHVDGDSQVGGFAAKKGGFNEYVKKNGTAYNPAGRGWRNSDLWYDSVDEPHGLTGIGDEIVGLDVNAEAYSGAHYAAFPSRLIEPLIKCSTSEAGCCAQCGTPWQRVKTPASGGAIGAAWLDHAHDDERGAFKTASSKGYKSGVTMYWEPACSCHGRDGKPERIPCTVLDPFMGSGTSAAVSAKLGRRSWGIEVSLRYIEDHQVQRITDALHSKASLHDQIVERPRKVFQPSAAFAPPDSPEENSVEPDSDGTETPP